MNDLMYIIWAAGALVLVAGALYGYRMSWRKGLIYALAWAAIFTIVTLLIDAANA